MKRILSVLAVLLAFCLILTACGGSGKKPMPAPDELARTLLDSGIFSEALEEADPDIAAYLYGLTEADTVELHSWLSTGATAEELTLFVCGDEAMRKTLRESADARLEFQKQTFADYAPDEVPKLEKAIIRVRDNVLVVCVAADPEKAAKLLDPYFPA